MTPHLETILSLKDFGPSKIVSPQIAADYVQPIHDNAFVSYHVLLFALHLDKLIAVVCGPSSSLKTEEV